MTDLPQPVATLPRKAVSDGNNVLTPAIAVLRGLFLLPDEKDLATASQASSVLGGPPASVALIEANATALSKWWAAGLGAAVAATWGTITTWWQQQDQPVQEAVLWGAAISTAAAILTIGYIIGSDVRGRASAMVATIEARATVAEVVIEASQALYEPEPAAAAGQVLALPSPLAVRYRKVLGDQEGGWLALAVDTGGNTVKYLIVKGSNHLWAESADVVVDQAVAVSTRLGPGVTA